MNNGAKMIFPKALNLDNLIFRIGEVSKMLNVSTRQLRYWEQKGYIQSMRNKCGESRVFDMKNFMCINLMKYYLNQGFTLAKSHEFAKQNLKNMKLLRNFMTNSFQGIENVNDRPAINLGYFDKEQTSILYGFIDNEDSVSYKVIKK
ncbi:MerR family transcriptional regulator [Apilactobacillus apisilvae]|uniref:MerR family transcriptional regulator n=1 Tax=Apilactobacillus apisilvae TaxID=2923364 RepID=A0ABY4PG73_9LACO|nr:MerR family transcriptional regulator [Apilactobacillus apisilvae]UQS84541.1 MerR family transcriptional regulator [Apilactobacillus apisilvae]